jgi:hypothetical protein
MGEIQEESAVVIPKKLTPGEISASVEKIRKRYDEYITKYFRPRSLRRAFEERYMAALNAKVDISSFLIAEISAVEELIEREEQRVMQNPVRQAAKEKEPSFADRVLEENRARISAYRDLAFHPDAGEEVRRLAGALTDFEQTTWPDIGSALQETMYAPSSSEMLALDSELRILAASGRDEVPAGLSRLVTELGRFPRSYPSIDREEKEYILGAAFFLNDLSGILSRVTRVYTDLPEASKTTLGAAAARVAGLVADFRLKDLKRQRRGARAEG